MPEGAIQAMGAQIQVVSQWIQELQQRVAAQAAAQQPSPTFDGNGCRHCSDDVIADEARDLPEGCNVGGESSRQLN